MSVKVQHWKDGWYVVIHRDSRRHTKKCDSEELAAELAEEMENRLRLLGTKGLTGFSRRVKQKEIVVFANYADKWLREQKKSSLKFSTVQRYESLLTNHLKPAFEKMALREISYAKLKSFCLEKVEKDFSKDSIRLMIATVRLILKEAQCEELIQVNPATNLGRFFGSRKGKQNRSSKKTEPFNREEISSVLEITQERFPEYYAFILTGFHTGLRFGEQRALQFVDIDFMKHRLQIQRNWPANRPIEDTPKTKTSIRTVDLSQTLENVLGGVRAKAKERCLAKGKEFDQESWLFVDLDGEPIEHWRFVKNVWKRVLHLAEVRWRNWHQVRHTYASQLLLAGANPVYVSEQLGHSKVSTTLNIYAHWIEEAGRRRQIDLLSTSLEDTQKRKRRG